MDGLDKPDSQSPEHAFKKRNAGAAMLHKFAQSLPGYFMLRRLALAPYWKRQMSEWEAAGRPTPMPMPVKHAALRMLAAEHGAKIFVETGTNIGDTVELMLPHFEKLYSIEVFEPLYNLCRRRFKNNPKVTLVKGDSATELAGVIAKLDKPALFWLDGHYSGPGTGKGGKDTPIYEELSLLFKTGRTDFTILIDDARCFGDPLFPAYPTIPALREFVESNSPHPLSFTVENDIIRLLPAHPQRF